MGPPLARQTLVHAQIRTRRAYGSSVGDEPKPQHDRVHDRLDEWRDAERDAEKEEPGSAARKMARKRAEVARDDFHAAEDMEREVQGNHRPRRGESDESQDDESTG